MIASPMFNPLEFPLCLEEPQRLTDTTSWHGHMPFAFAAVEMARPRVLVELGTQKGDSYCSFCQAVRTLHLACSCTAVDTWKGDEQTSFYGEEVFTDLTAYHDPLYGSFSRLLRATFDEGLGYLEDGAIDLLHIDGLHTYDAVKHDLESWLPKLSARGVLLMHDTNVLRDDFGVWRLFRELGEHYPTFEFKHSFGLGVVGVGSALPEPFQRLSSLDEGARVEVGRFFERLAAPYAVRRELEAALGERDHTIATLEAAEQVLKGRVQELQERARALQVGSETLQKEARALEQRNGALAGEHRGMQEQLRLHQVQLHERDGRLGERQTHIEVLQARQRELESEIAALAGHLDAIRRGRLMRLLNAIHG